MRRQGITTLDPRMTTCLFRHYSEKLVNRRALNSVLMRKIHIEIQTAPNSVRQASATPWPERGLRRRKGRGSVHHNVTNFPSV